MKQWKYTLRLGDLFHNDALTFEEKRDRMVARMKAQPWWNKFDDETWLGHDLATAADVDEWDEYWDLFYDWADTERIWVETRERAFATD